MALDKFTHTHTHVARRNLFVSFEICRIDRSADALFFGNAEDFSKIRGFAIVDFLLHVDMMIDKGFRNFRRSCKRVHRVISMISRNRIRVRDQNGISMQAFFRLVMKEMRVPRVCS